MSTKNSASRSKPRKQSPRREEEVRIPPEARLSPPQLIFIEEYLATGSKKAAAEAAGVHRSTPYDWFRNDFEFVAEYNRRKREVGKDVKARFAALRLKALNVIEAAIDDGDVPSAWRVLEASEAPGPDQPGSEDADLLIKEAVSDEIYRIAETNHRLASALNRVTEDLHIEGGSIAGTRVLDLLVKMNEVVEVEVEEGAEEEQSDLEE